MPMTLRNTLLLPLKASFDLKISAPLLLALLFYPEKLQEILPTNLLPVLQTLQSSAGLAALKILVGLGVARKINNALTGWSQNNFMAGKKLVAEEELVVISGGSSGIGALMAKMFAGKGVKVCVLDLTEGKEKLPPNVFFYQCDVTNSTTIHSVASRIRKEHGEPTILINNAGIGSSRTILNSSESLIRKTFEVNTMAHYWMVREFLPDMIKRNHGHVVTIASMASFIVHAQNVDYSCTKASALAFHEGLSSELRNRYEAPGVRTSVVHPSWIRTPLIESLTERKDFSDPVLEPEDVADAVVKQVMSGRGAQIILPSDYNIMSTIRAWPTWMQLAVRNKIAPLFDFYRGENDSFLKE